jgi:hypothetical protein
LFVLVTNIHAPPSQVYKPKDTNNKTASTTTTTDTTLSSRQKSQYQLLQIINNQIKISLKTKDRKNACPKLVTSHSTLSPSGRGKLHERISLSVQGTPARWIFDTSPQNDG